MTRTAPRFVATTALTLALLAAGSTLAAAVEFAPAHDTSGLPGTANGASDVADKEPTAEEMDPGRVLSHDFVPCWSVRLCSF